jgi:hypothetical protein
MITQHSKIIPPTLPDWKNCWNINRLIFFDMAKNNKIPRKKNLFFSTSLG